jgi:hypothetical protein
VETLRPYRDSWMNSLEALGQTQLAEIHQLRHRETEASEQERKSKSQKTKASS